MNNIIVSNAYIEFLISYPSKKITSKLEALILIHSYAPKTKKLTKTHSKYPGQYAPPPPYQHPTKFEPPFRPVWALVFSIQISTSHNIRIMISMATILIIQHHQSAETTKTKSTQSKLRNARLRFTFHATLFQFFYPDII